MKEGLLTIAEAASISGVSARTMQRWVKAGWVAWEGGRRKGADPARGIAKASLNLVERTAGKAPLRYQVKKQLSESGYDPPAVLTFLICAAEGGADLDLVASGIRFCLAGNAEFLDSLIRGNENGAIPALCARMILAAGRGSGYMQPILRDLPFTNLWEWLETALRSCHVDAVPYLFTRNPAKEGCLYEDRFFLLLPRWIEKIGRQNFLIPHDIRGRFLGGFFLNSVWFPYAVPDQDQTDSMVISAAMQLHKGTDGGLNKALEQFPAGAFAIPFGSNGWLGHNFKEKKQVPGYGLWCGAESRERYDISSGRKEISDATVARIFGVSRAAICQSKKAFSGG